MTPQPAYDRIGEGYAQYRRPDPSIARLVDGALGTARTIVSVGSGTGSYEPIDRWVVAIEPSSVMIRQRRPRTAAVVRAVAQSLPVRSSSFDAALAVLTIYHWPDPRVGLAEMRRVARRQVVLTFDPEVHSSHWLVDYVPGIATLFKAAPPICVVAEALDAARVVPVPLRYDTPDGMTIAYWRRPEAYLDSNVRAGGSALQQVDPQALARGLGILKADLESGRWEQRYRHLLQAESMDHGLRLIMN